MLTADFLLPIANLLYTTDYIINWEGSVMKKSLMAFIIICLAFIATTVFAQEEVEKISFTSKTGYDIYYVVSDFEVDKLEQVEILDSVKINDIVFLSVRGTNFAYKDETGYIQFDRIRAILPSGLIRPERTFDQDKKKR